MKVPEGYEKLDLYNVLDCIKSSNNAEIAKAYKRAALKTHPDKSGGSDEAFGKVAFAYSILSDEQKRLAYDETGQVLDMDVSLADLVRESSRRVTDELIEEDKDEYRKSQEHQDLLESYNIYNGNFDKIIEYVLHTEADEQDRLIEKLEKLVNDNELPKRALFIKTTTPQARKKRMAKMMRERTLASESTMEESTTEELANSIRKRNSEADADFIAQMEAKYGKPAKRSKPAKKSK